MCELQEDEMSGTRYGRYSPSEEIKNSITHGIGLGFSIAALAILVTFAGLYRDVWRVVSFSIYWTTLILLYLASTLYHSFQSLKMKRIFHVLDHSAIFLLIAGTYTPLTLVTLRGGWGWTLFGLIWGLAICGIILKIFFMSRFKLVSILVYIGMGWLVIIALKPLLSALGTGGFIWIGIGGLAYTLGVIFYVWQKIPFNHAIAWRLVSSYAEDDKVAAEPFQEVEIELRHLWADYPASTNICAGASPHVYLGEEKSWSQSPYMSPTAFV
jgi:hemolysin III